jgi:hypothetical protein
VFFWIGAGVATSRLAAASKPLKASPTGENTFDRAARNRGARDRRGVNPGTSPLAPTAR